MPSETNGTPIDTVELVGELMSCVADLESGTGPDGSHAQIQHPHADLLRRAATTLARQGEAREIGEFVIRHTAGWQVLTVSHDPAAYDEVRFKIVFGKNGVVCGPTLLSAIRSATTPQTKETPNAE